MHHITSNVFVASDEQYFDHFKKTSPQTFVLHSREPFDQRHDLVDRCRNTFFECSRSEQLLFRLFAQSCRHGFSLIDTVHDIGPLRCSRVLFTIFQYHEQVFFNPPLVRSVGIVLHTRNDTLPSIGRTRKEKVVRELHTSPSLHRFVYNPHICFTMDTTYSKPAHNKHKET